MSNEVTIEWNNAELTLLNTNAIYWKRHSAILLADLHAGKAAHFRKNGIPLSTDHLLNDLNLISSLLNKYEAKSLYVLGDLFHSTSNIEHTMVDDWISNLNLNFTLVVGNHDVYSRHNFKTVYELEIDNILLTHEPVENHQANIFGHLHPGFSLKGKGRQHLSFPSFYINPQFIALPAFGRLNGRKNYKELQKKSVVYLTTEEGLIKV